MTRWAVKVEDKRANCLLALLPALVIVLIGKNWLCFAVFASRRARRRSTGTPHPVVYRALRAAIPSGLRRHCGNGSGNGTSDLGDGDEGIDRSGENCVDPSRGLTHCFLRLAHLDPGTFERLGRYEAALWRQIVH